MDSTASISVVFIKTIAGELRGVYFSITGNYVEVDVIEAPPINNHHGGRSGRSIEVQSEQGTKHLLA